VKALLDEMISNNYHWSSERASLKRSGDKYDVDAVDLLASKVDVLAQCLDRHGAPTPWSSSRHGVWVGVVYEICGIQGHIAIDCQTNFQGLEHANAFKISTHGDKTTLTQTLTTQDEKIIQISPTETPTPCRPMPLNPLASRIDHLITHLYPLYNNVTCKFLWSTSTQTKAKDMLLEKFDYGALILYANSCICDVVHIF